MSTALEAFFAGRIHEGGRALRRTTLRHTHIAEAPLGMPSSRSATSRSTYQLSVTSWSSNIVYVATFANTRRT
jgi:hypothetical protein